MQNLNLVVTTHILSEKALLKGQLSLSGNHNIFPIYSSTQFCLLCTICLYPNEKKSDKCFASEILTQIHSSPNREEKILHYIFFRSCTSFFFHFPQLSILHLSIILPSTSRRNFVMQLIPTCLSVADVDFHQLAVAQANGL